MVRCTMMLAFAMAGLGLAPAPAPAGGSLPEKVAPYVGPLLKLLPKLLDPGEISSKGHTEVLGLSSEGQSKLIISRSMVQVVVKKTHEKWTGDYHLTMKIPCKVSYAVDLGSAGRLSSSWDANRKQLKVAAPAVEVYAVEPMLAERQCSFRRTGVRWSNSGVEAELKEAALDEVDREARRHAAAEAPTLQRQAADRLRHILESKIWQVLPDGRVIVE